MVAHVDFALGSDPAPDGAPDRAELERTKIALDAAVRSFKFFAGTARLKAAASSMAAAAAEGDVERAQEAASALDAASRTVLTDTGGSTEGWPEELRSNWNSLQDRAAAFGAPSGESEVAGQAPIEHPQQLAARLKLTEVRLEIAEGRRRVEVIRRDAGTGSFRHRAAGLGALGSALVGLKLLERVERSYARAAARPPKSAALFERARKNREAAVVAFEHSEEHRQASRAALDAPVGQPWIAGTVQFLVGWTILGVAIAANYLVFRAFLDTNYFSWYLANGALISLVFGFVSLAVRLDDYPNLVSSNPMRYLYACLTLNLHLFVAWNQVIAVDPEHASGLLLSKLFDLVISLLAWIAVAVAFVGWLLVVAPIQYIPYAVLGAPARNALRNPSGPAFDPETDTTIPVSAEASKTGHVIGYVEKPVALTAALTAAVLWTLSEFVW